MRHKVLIGEAARRELRIGIDILANAVKATLGPGGRTAILSDGVDVKITKDGVSVAEEVKLDDVVHNIGAQIVKEVASKTAKEAGDGTTTATVLAQKMIELELVPSTQEREEIVELLKSKSQTTDNLKAVATISANGDETIGSLVSEAVKKTGKYGIVTPGLSDTSKDKLEYSKGVNFDEGYVTPQFVLDTKKLTLELDDCLIYMYEGEIRSTQDVAPVITLASQNRTSLLVIAREISGTALDQLIMLNAKGNVRCAAVQIPGFGAYRKPIMGDIAALTQGKFRTIEDQRKREPITKDTVGFANKVIVAKDECTIIVDDSGESLQKRITMIQDLIPEASIDYEKSFLEKRLAQLTGGTAKVLAGGDSKVSQEERRDRIEDAIFATKAAVKMGIVEGAGMALYKISEQFPQYADILQSPAKQIAKNARYDKVGLDARTGKEVEDLVEAGIIDPTLVVVSAFINACSIAEIFLTTESIVVNDSRNYSNHITPN